ncbi:E3 ubiquitin-protein ligase RNF13 isoform 2 [Schistosoma japonicum]|uniref:E3 ubiquitin-protein ligase RNF13 isoform 2 n=2 Tax=Schistosoma japonicum TaxID=6182 RepID=A0A4Z2DTX1_SCHJA|nr:E3 ubiquitin-protein ligase RNF13 isoform 2 [Schistosoma japonicum]
MRIFIFSSFACVILGVNVFAVVLVKDLSTGKTVSEFEDSEALFGNVITQGSLLLGRIHASQPINGCVDRIPLPKNASASTLPYISLIKRGNCSFSRKTIAAERGGYIAAIIFNDEDDSTFPMGHNTSEVINISAVMVGLSDGELLLKKYCVPHYFVEILSAHRRSIMLYLIPLITCLLLSIIALSVAYCIRLWDRHRRRRRYCLPVKELHKIPETLFKEGSSEFETCVICLEDYKDGDKLRLLPCRHAYHSKCVDPWLLRRRGCCPICKKKVHNRPRMNISNFTRFRRTSAYATTSEAPLLDDSSSFEGDSDSENASSTSHYSSSYGGDGLSNEQTPLINSSANQSSPSSFKRMKITASIRETLEGLLENVSSFNHLSGCPSSRCEQTSNNVNTAMEIQSKCSQNTGESLIKGKQSNESDNESGLSDNKMHDNNQVPSVITCVEVHTVCDSSSSIHESHA